MLQVPDTIRDNLYRKVKADLCPPRHVVHAKIGFAVTLGGLTTLFLCGQLGFGLSSLANLVHHWLMGIAGFLGCTMICGVLFAVIPVMTLRLMSSGIQFHLLTRKEWRAIAGWIMAFGGAVVYQNDQADPIWILLLWGLGAIASFGALSRIVHHVSVHILRAWPTQNPYPGQ